MKRRDFVRTVIMSGAGVGAMNASTKVFSSMPGENKTRVNHRHIVRETGHQLRDGHRFDVPEPTEFRDVVIVGAGANSLITAYELPDVDLVCLEKEPRPGGNAQRMKWGDIYATEGTAFMFNSGDLYDYMESNFGIKPIPLKSSDAYIVKNKIIHNLYEGGIDKLPYSQDIISEFHRMNSLIASEAEEISEAFEALVEGELKETHALYSKVTALEKQSFEDWLKEQGFPKEVIEWLDVYCPPQVSCYTRNMSAAVGITYLAGAGNYEGSATYPGGLAKMAETLADAVREQNAERIRTGCFVVRVANSEDGKYVDVTYQLANKLRTIRCKVCVWGAQKHIAKHVIADMPANQKSAIGKMVYNDLSVMNLCYRKTIYNEAYYTWLNNAPMNNILPADWVLKEGKGDPNSPQILTCDWSSRPEHRGLLLSDQWVVQQCQEAAQYLNRVFPGSIEHLEEVRLVLRAHSWVAESPAYYSELVPLISNNIGRVVMSSSTHSSFDGALEAGLENARTVKQFLNRS